MDWNEVKEKPKKKKKPTGTGGDNIYGGVISGGMRANTTTTGGTGGGKFTSSNAASAIANYDPSANIDSDEEIKYEQVSHDCAVAVANARMAKKLTQAQLAKAVNEKPGVIVEIENGTGPYEADIINRIEKVLGV